MAATLLFYIRHDCLNVHAEKQKETPGNGLCFCLCLGYHGHCEQLPHPAQFLRDINHCNKDAAMYDLVIENALIVDGTGAKPVSGGLAVKGDRIEAMGPEINAAVQAAKRHDAKGQVVAPAFIDVHSHSDAQFLENDRTEAKLLQGIGTEITGQCGISVVPNADETLEFRLPYFKAQFSERFCNTMDFKALRSIKDYARMSGETKHTINTALLIGHGALRTAVMGFSGESPTAAQQERMEKILDESIADGAWGLSLGLAYSPGNFSKLPELAGLARVVARQGATVHVHMRNESVGVFDSVREMIDVARESGAHVHISHLKLMGKAQWGRAPELIAMLEKARAEGLKITADQYPYTGSSTGLIVLVPKWALEGGIAAFLKRLRSPERERVTAGITQEMDSRGGPNAVMISTNGLFPEYDFRRMDELAAKENLPPGEMAANILEKAEGNARAIYFSMDMNDVLHIMRSDFVGVGSDGYAFNFDEAKGAHHPRNFGTFPRFIRTVLDEKVMSLEKAVWKTTGLAAETMGLKQRGVLAPGNMADIVIFDPERIRDKATFDNAFQKPVGIAAVIVAGQITAANNELTGARAGKLLLRRQK